MGWSISWLAIKGKPAQLVRSELGFELTGKFEEFAESEFSAVELGNGWYLIGANRREQVVSEAALKQLTLGCEAVTCFAEEHVMVSKATGWKNGQMDWSVLHESENKKLPIATQGELPPDFISIRERLEAEQHAADAAKQNVDCIFDIPVELAFSLVGFRHDQSIPELPDSSFEVLLKQTSSQKSSFLKRLFGGS